MYVKVEHFNGRGKYTMYEPQGEIITGHFFGTDEAPDAQQVLGFDHWHFSASWFVNGPTGKYEEEGKVKGDCWDLRYAWWYSEDGVIQAVITPGRIFLLSDNGKTVDRV